jgi:MFS family permease
MGTLLILCIDVFVEHNSTNNDTGKIRSFYLTSINIAWFMSPWITGMILSDGEYWKVYFISALIMVAIIFMAFYNLDKFKDESYKEFKPISTLKEVWKKKDIKCILISNFLLQFFYAWMVIYTPIYLIRYVGFDWQTLGMVFTIMLLPFVFIEIPLGRIADKYIGEKEMLNVGFLITIFSVALIPFVSGKDFWVWAILLFTTRIGAAMIEIMTETYFFKKISDKNVNLISIFRSMSTIAYIITPIIVTISLVFLPFSYTFFVLAVVMIFGLKYSLAIKDTR